LNISIKIKLFFTFFLFGVILIFTTIFVSTNISNKSIKKVALDNARSQFIKNRDAIRLFMDEMESKIISISNSLIFTKHIEKQYTQAQLEELFLTIAESSQNIMQIRLIDKNGNEIIKVLRDAYWTKPYLQEPKKLQNKKERYYFKEIISQTRGNVWISKIDLNIEYGKIEKPIKPTIRLGLPVYNKDEKIGIIIINVFMKKLLDTIRSSKLYNVYIIDKDGYFIINPNPKYNWSRYIGEKKTIKDFFKDYEKILYNDEYYSDKIYSSVLNIQNSDKLKMILEPTDEFIASAKKDLQKDIFYLMIILIILSIPVSIYFAKKYTLLSEQIDKANTNLEEKIKEKTKELKELTKNLEKKVEERTNEQNILLSLFDLGDSVLFKWRNDESWSVAYVSKSVEKLIEYTRTDFINGDVKYADLIHPDDIKTVIEEVNEAIEKKLYFFTHKPYRIITKTKKIKWIHDSTVVVKDKNGEIINFVGYLIDITDIKTKEIKLKKISITDALTKIYNRLYLDETLKKQYYRLHRNKEKCSIILMDIDYFKKINDKYGHIVGDKVLIEMTNVINNHLRESDVFGRWGGEEFMIIAPYTDIYEAEKIAYKIKDIIQKYNFEEVGRVTMSFGVYECKKDKTLDENITEADKALYKSKEDGRNTVTISI